MEADSISVNRPRAHSGGHPRASSRKRSILVFAIVLGAIGHVGTVRAADGLTIACDAPEGVSIGQSGKFQRDGYSGTKPHFILSEADPERLQVYFRGNPLEVSGQQIHLTSARTEAVVVKNSGGFLSAVEVLPKDVWNYSFYPDSGAGIFTRTSRALGPQGGLFVASCTFEFGTIPAAVTKETESKVDSGRFEVGESVAFELEGVRGSGTIADISGDLLLVENAETGKLDIVPMQQVVDAQEQGTNAVNEGKKQAE